MKKGRAVSHTFSLIRNIKLNRTTRDEHMMYVHSDVCDHCQKTHPLSCCYCKLLSLCSYFQDEQHILTLLYMIKVCANLLSYNGWYSKAK